MPPGISLRADSDESVWLGQNKSITQEYERSAEDNWICVTQTVDVDDYEVREILQRERTDYTYNNKEQCVKEEYKKYNNPEDQTDYQSIVTEYTYDTAGYNDLLKLKRFGNDEYSISYEYDNTYHLPTKRTFKQDEDTTVIENYTLTSDKKSTASVQVTENNATKRRVDYIYDSYGNVLTEKRYTGENNWNDFMQVNYSYNDLSDNINKINDAYISKISVSGVNDADGNPVSAQPGGIAGTIEYTYTYDWFGNVLTETDGNGNTYSYTYDKLNRPTVMTNPEQGTIGFSYGTGALNNYVQTADENGNVMKYTYLSMGAIKEEKDVTADKVLRSYSYDFHESPLCTKKEVTNYSDYGNTTVTTTFIDALNRPIETETADKSGNIVYREEYKYELAVDNLYDRVTKTVKGETQDQDYTVKQYIDKFGNIVKEEAVYNNNGTQENLVTEYTYDYAGNLLTVKSPRAAAENWTDGIYTAQYEYDIDGQVTKTTDIYGNYSVNEYDGLGRLIRSADAEAMAAPIPYYSTFTYDVLGRLLKEQIPYDDSGDSILYGENKYYYDNNGNVVKLMTKNGSGSSDYSIVQTTYNWRNTPVKVLTDGTDSAYYYDAVGNVLRMYTGELTDFTISGLDNVSGGEYEVTKYSYDTQNRLISTTDSLNQTSTNTYDITGVIVKTVDRNQNILNNIYDPMGNLIEKSAQKNKDAAKESMYTYTYNRMGLPLTMTGNGVTTNYIYDNLGRLIRESLTDGTVKEYNYDSNGNRTQFKLTVNGAEQMNTVYTYDKLDRLRTVTNGTSSSSYTYNNNGQLLTDAADGFITEYDYNAGGLISGLTTQKGDMEIQSHSYQYLPDGNISQKQSTVGTQTTRYSYQYDNAGRLVQEQTGTDTKSYTYDAFGNRSEMTVTGEENLNVAYSYDANNRLLKMTKTGSGIDEETLYTYDKNGNQLSWNKSVYSALGTPGISFETDGKDFALFDYDMYNRVVSFTNGVTEASYTYDGNNLRQSKKVDGITTSHIWDGANMVMETSGAGVNRYYRGVNGIIYADQRGTISYYQKDAHGDTTALTDAAGTITKNYLYDAFGNEQTQDSIDINPFRYAGEYYDAESGNIYLRNRYYDASTGRFISEDPIQDGVNWYAYAGNNPVLFVDPWGLIPGDVTNESFAELTEEQQAGVRAAIRERDRGYISAEYAAKVCVDLGVEIEPYPGIYIEENRDKIIITAHVSFINEITIDHPYRTFDEYKSGIIDGITKQWSGKYKNKTIVTNLIIEKNDDIYDTVEITIIADNGASKGMFGSSNNITLYNASGGKTYTEYEMGLVAAHEFGHAAFKIADIYNNREFKKDIKALMNSPFHGRTVVDFALMARHSMFQNTSIYNTQLYIDTLTYFAKQ